MAITPETQTIQGIEISQPVAEPVSAAVLQERRLRMYSLMMLTLVPYVLFIAVFFGSTRFFGENATSFPGGAAILEMMQSSPMMLCGYFFGVLGGITRSFSDLGSMGNEVRVRGLLQSTFISGVLGMMTYLALDSGFLIKLVYPEIDISTQGQIGFRGVAVVSFLVGFFAGESILFGRARILQAIQTNNSRNNTGGNNNAN